MLLWLFPLISRCLKAKCSVCYNKSALMRTSNSGALFERGEMTLSTRKQAYTEVAQQQWCLQNLLLWRSRHSLWLVRSKTSHLSSCAPNDDVCHAIYPQLYLIFGVIWQNIYVITIYWYLLKYHIRGLYTFSASICCWACWLYLSECDGLSTKHADLFALWSQCRQKLHTPSNVSVLESS